MSRLAEKLAERIKRDTGIVVVPVIFRTYAGRWMRARGAWSWQMLREDGFAAVGSQFTATECLAAKKLSYDLESDTIPDINIDVEKS